MKRLIPILIACMLMSCSAPQPPLRVGLLEWPPYSFARLAERLGYYDEDRIEIVEFHSPAEVVRAYRVGGLDVVAFTVDFAMALAGDAADTRAFLIIDESVGADAAISRTPLEDLSELAGKRIALEASELGAHLLGRMLDRASLTIDDVEIEFIDIPDQLYAWQNNQADIIITYEPIRTQMLDSGGHEIFSSADIPGEVVDIFAAREAIINARLPDFQAFTSGWFRALDFFRQNPQQALQFLTEETGFSRARFETMLEGARMISLAENRRLLGRDNAAFVESLSRFVSTGSASDDEKLQARLSTLLTDIALPAQDD